MRHPMTHRRALPLLASLVLIAAVIAGGCAQMDAPRGSPPVGVAAQALQGGAPGVPGAPAAADRAMRITVETSVTVPDIEAAGRVVRELTAKHGGYVGEATTSGDEDNRWASFEVHVPVAHLPAFRAGVTGLGEVSSDAEKAEDVTEQRADIKARLGNARAEEKRLLELLEKGTGTLADVVAVEKELASVRETIERMEAQERVLEGQIASATVKIHLSTRHAAARLGPGKRIFHAFGDGFDAAGAFLVGLAVAAASAGPTLLILVLMGYAVFRAVWFFVRRRAARAG
jgi:hypothetical protein